MRIFVIVGTRPEAIKMLPLVRELRKHEELQTKICFTRQHSRMAEEVFDEFGIPYDFSFSEMKKGRNLSEMTLYLLKNFDMIFEKEKPDLVLVHGDTTSAFCGAIAAFYRGILVAHIEAGLRSFNNLLPYPEEFNRVSIDALSSLHFAPTKIAADNLKKEGKTSVFTVGNTVIDAIRYSLEEKDDISLFDGLGDKKLLLITAHRRENLGDKMRSSMQGISDILRVRNDLFAILPLHPNPAVREIALESFKNIKNIKICDPLPMRLFHSFLSASFAVFTDSGGIQEEAAYLGIPLFLLRENTERPECLELGNTLLVGSDREKIKKEFFAFLNDEKLQKKMRKRSFAFGDGHASEKIVRELLNCIAKLK